MSIPSLQAEGGIYKLDWASEKIHMRIDRILESSKHEVTGEVLVENHAPGTLKHLSQSRLNMTSAQAKKTLATTLNGRVDTVPWLDLIEQACVLVIQRHREGAPAIRLAEMTQPDDTVYRLFPYIQEHQATLILGDGDTGKSFLGILLAVLVASDTHCLGMVPKEGPVLYLDYETDPETVWHRVNRISAGLNIPIPEEIIYRHMTQSVAADYEALNKIVSEEQIMFLVVDSAAPASIKPEESEHTIAYFNALRDLGPSTLTIAHLSKGEREDRPFGSIFWRNMPRSLYRVNAAHDPGSPQFLMGLKHVKSNNEQRQKDTAFQLVFGENDLVFTMAKAADIPELADTLPIHQRIALALKNMPMTPKELNQYLPGTSEASIKTVLNRFRDKMFVIISTDPGGNNKWANMHQDRHA